MVKVNLIWPSALLAIIVGTLVLSYYGYGSTGGAGGTGGTSGSVVEGGPTSRGTLMQLAAKGAQDLYLTGARGYGAPYYQWGHGFYGPSYHGSYQTYRPVKTHPDYDFPHYYQSYKYPYYFDRGLPTNYSYGYPYGVYGTHLA